MEPCHQLLMRLQAVVAVSLAEPTVPSQQSDSSRSSPPAGVLPLDFLQTGYGWSSSAWRNVWDILTWCSAQLSWWWFDVEEQWLYSQLLVRTNLPTPISQGDPYHQAWRLLSDSGIYDLHLLTQMRVRMYIEGDDVLVQHDYHCSHCPNLLVSLPLYLALIHGYILEILVLLQRG